MLKYSKKKVICVKIFLICDVKKLINILNYNFKVHFIKIKIKKTS